jgi:heptosyltransferase III
MTSPKNILIVRTDRIGDVILSLPLAPIFKKYFPGSHVSFLLREYTRALADGSQFINEVVVLNETNGNIPIRKNVLKLRNKFDACIIAFPTFKIALILFLAGIKIRIGSGYRWYSFLFNKKVYEHRKYGERHELEFNVRLLQHLGIYEEPGKSSVQFGLSASESAKEKVKQDLLELGIDLTNPMIIFHPGSGGSAIDFPANKMKLLIEKVSSEINCVVLITGNKTEKELCRTMIVNSRIINMAGKYNLEELIALIDYSQILVANSTGPIHIAAALGKFVVGFYPKFAAVAPKRWGPYTENAAIFQPGICDNNCSREQCKQINCMNSIEVEDVFPVIKQKVIKYQLQIRKII